MSDTMDPPRSVDPTPRSAPKKNGKNGHAIMQVDTPKLDDLLKHDGPVWSKIFGRFKWKTVTAEIKGDGGGEVFRQEGVEVPVGWSDTAANIVASKYFRGVLGTASREYSVKQLVCRVVETIALHGVANSYFDTVDPWGPTVHQFREHLARLVIEQRMAFNSPVWFNVGAVGAYPQVSACFLLSVEDSMESILDWYKEEGLVFRGGSGAGVNLSKLRGKGEGLSGGGRSSGPVSFMKAADASAGSIASGGRTRRAAKLVSLDVDHPDIFDFVRCKVEEERKARALIAAGFDGGFNVIGGAYDSVAFQNANHSVRVPDSFMKAVAEDREWSTVRRTDGRANTPFKARQLWDAIVDAAWDCGDPGVQFMDRITEWHTVPESGPITTSNPCGEFLHVDDSSCNLASLNLLKYVHAHGRLDTFDAEAFRDDVSVTTVAMEILVDLAGYPTETMARVTKTHRPLGLGFTNLGATLMACGEAYDSDKGRGFAAGVTAVLAGTAYATSAMIAAKKGPFEAFEKNQHAMLKVVNRHRDAAYALASGPLRVAATKVWDDAVTYGTSHGFRNSQVVVLAPTGTISLMMDAVTTGIEPELSLVKFKKLIGGGTIKMVNPLVDRALHACGFDDSVIKEVTEHLTAHGSLARYQATAYSAEIRAVLATSFGQGEDGIAVDGHLKMMAAVAPFVSGWISKTVNLPNEATRETISEVYQKAWRMGLKSVAIYRDGCKRTQPLSTKEEPKSEPRNMAMTAAYGAAYGPTRRRLPQTRRGSTIKFAIGNHEGYLTANTFDDGTIGEVFINMNAEGSTLSGVMDTLATTISIALQYGVPLEVLVRKYTAMRYEPAGITDHPNIRFVKSLSDYIGRLLGQQFLPAEKQRELGIALVDEPGEASKAAAAEVVALQADAPSCGNCGSIMQRRGSCYTCGDCGATTGCG